MGEPADLDLALVRCFAVLAEHRHFGRAAAALHLTPSSLSRQLRRLEGQVGARLMDRTPRGSELTEAGRTFLPLATALLRSAAEATARARSVAEPGRVTIGFTGYLVVTPAVRELRRRFPDAEVRTRFLEHHDVRAALLEHRVDAAVVRLPLPTDGLRVTVLHEEDRVLLMPADHRLAGRESITMADIADEPMPRSDDPLWDAFWRVDPRPDGRPAPGGPHIAAVEDKIELVASGQAVALLPAGLRVEGLRPDLRTVPLRDLAPSHVALAVRAGDRGRLVSAFRRAAENGPKM